MPTRTNILLRTFPESVELHDGRIFYAKYERIKIANLPPNVTVRRTYNRTIGPRRQRRPRQRGCRIKTVLKKAFNLGKRATISSLGKMLIQEGLEYTPHFMKKTRKE